jgi:hypothetical protein
MPRRRLLLASATTLPLLLATTGCHSADLFAGPDPLAGTPPLAHDTVMLKDAITAELRLIARYQSAISGASHAQLLASLLESLLAQHQDHLAKLHAMLVVSAGTPASRTAFLDPPTPPAVSPSVEDLRADERQSATTLVKRLATAEPALAQLLASIAASDATHAAALS